MIRSKLQFRVSVVVVTEAVGADVEEVVEEVEVDEAHHVGDQGQEELWSSKAIK